LPLPCTHLCFGGSHRMEDRASPDIAADEASLLYLKASVVRTPSPAEVVLRYEDRAEEWHFDEAIHKSQLEDHRALSTAFKEREQQAKQKHSHHADGHEQEIAQLLASAEAEERRCAVELAGLREELVEAQHAIEEVEEQCEQQVVDFDTEMRAERQRRAAIEKELATEKVSVEEATRHITGLEDSEGEAMRLKRTRMAENRSNCRRQCSEVQQAGDREIQQIGRALREEVDAIQKQIDQKMKETQRGVDSCVQSRRNVRSETERQISEAVDTKVYQGLAAVEMQVLEAREKSLGQIKEVQARDFEHEVALRERIGAALVSVNCSMQEREQISLLEKSHKKQLASATDILGCSLPTNRYALHDNRRLRSAGASAMGF